MLTPKPASKVKSEPSTNGVLIEYVNHRKEWGVRRIIPVRIYFGATEWHPDSQWLLQAYDLDKQALRDFAMRDIRNWLPLEQT